MPEYERKEKRMEKKDMISKVLNDLDAYQAYLDSNFEEFSHAPVDSGTLYSFGKQTFYVLSSIIETINDIA